MAMAMAHLATMTTLLDVAAFASLVVGVLVPLATVLALLGYLLKSRLQALEDTRREAATRRR